MNEDTLNMNIRKFLKQVGVTSQREIEHAVQKMIDSGKFNGSETFEVKMTLEAPAVGLTHHIDGRSPWNKVWFARREACENKSVHSERVRTPSI